MDCKFFLINNAWVCKTHDSTASADICHVAEQELRAEIAWLTECILDLERRLEQ